MLPLANNALIIESNKDFSDYFSYIKGVPGFFIVKNLLSKYAVISDDYASLSE